MEWDIHRMSGNIEDMIMVIYEKLLGPLDMTNLLGSVTFSSLSFPIITTCKVIHEKCCVDCLSYDLSVNAAMGSWCPRVTSHGHLIMFLHILTSHCSLGQGIYFLACELN